MLSFPSLPLPPLIALGISVCSSSCQLHPGFGILPTFLPAHLLAYLHLSNIRRSSTPTQLCKTVCVDGKILVILPRFEMRLCLQTCVVEPCHQQKQSRLHIWRLPRAQANPQADRENMGLLQTSDLLGPCFVIGIRPLAGPSTSRRPKFLDFRAI